jgi:hypothetical protein
MTTEMPGTVVARVAVMLVRRAGVVMMRVNGLMRIGGKAGESGKCCGPSLKREQKQNNYRDPFMPDCHERVQSIEKPKSLQPTEDDIFGARKFEADCGRERIRSGLARLENQEVLIRQKGMLLDERVTGVLQFRFHAIRRNARAFRRTVRRVQAEIDDCDATAGP